MLKESEFFTVEINGVLRLVLSRLLPVLARLRILPVLARLVLPPAGALPPADVGVLDGVLGVLRGVLDVLDFLVIRNI